LHLTCDASQPTIVPQAEDGTERLWPAQTALRELNFWHSQVPEVARIPYILAKVFPALSRLHWCNSAGSFTIRNVSRPVLEDVWEQLRILQNTPDHDDNYDSDMEWEEDSDDSDDSEDSDEDDPMGGV
jgi:hypothetical protein